MVAQRGCGTRRAERFIIDSISIVLGKPPENAAHSRAPLADEIIVLCSHTTISAARGDQARISVDTECRSTEMM